MSLGGWIEYLKDIFFPINCLKCNKEGSFVCEKCLGTLDLSGVFCCPTCHKDTKNGEYCSSCIPAFITRQIAAIKYDEKSLIGEVVHSFKYQYVEELQKTIFQMLELFLKQYNLDGVDVITYVPLHRRRYVERGFNQAEKIASALGKLLDKPVINYLKRTHYTKPQANFGRKERLTNLQDAFIFDSKEDIVNKNILLVDDVFTTGSTIQECAKVLKNNNVGSVVGFSLARG